MLRSKPQSGQALVAATLGLVALLGATGLAIDMGFLRYQKRLQQSAADSAALAGAAETGFGGDVTFAAQQDASLNGFALGGATNVTVTVNPNYKGNANAVEVLVSAVQPTFFMKIFGVNTATVTSRAVAQFSGNGVKNCIYALGRGSSIDNDDTIIAPSCGIISNGDFFTGGGRVTAASIGVVGAADTNNINPTPVTGIVAAADPLAYLNSPATPTCTGDLVVTGTTPPPGGGGRRRRPPPPPPPLRQTVDPGVYCKIVITGNADVTFRPGTYVVTTGDISFGGNGTVTGSGVTFYMKSGSLSLSNTVAFNLTAPTADPYTGILFFQDRANAKAATIDGKNGSTLQGAFYFPDAMLTVNGAAANAAYMIFVAQSMELATAVNFPSNYSSLTGGSPIKNAVLVE